MARFRGGALYHSLASFLLVFPGETGKAQFCDVGNALLAPRKRKKKGKRGRRTEKVISWRIWVLRHVGDRGEGEEEKSPLL